MTRVELHNEAMNKDAEYSKQIQKLQDLTEDYDALKANADALRNANLEWETKYSQVRTDFVGLLSFVVEITH